MVILVAVLVDAAVVIAVVAAVVAVVVVVAVAKRGAIGPLSVHAAAGSVEVEFEEEAEAEEMCMDVEAEDSPSSSILLTLGVLRNATSSVALLVESTTLVWLRAVEGALSLASIP